MGAHPLQDMHPLSTAPPWGPPPVAIATTGTLEPHWASPAAATAVVLLGTGQSVDTINKTDYSSTLRDSHPLFDHPQMAKQQKNL